MAFEPGSFGEAFFEGFRDGVPDNYSFTADVSKDTPWCEPWLSDCDDWFDPNKTPYEMGVAYANSIYDALEEEFQKLEV